MKHIITGVFGVIAIVAAVAARNTIVFNKQYMTESSVAAASTNAQPAEPASEPGSQAAVESASIDGVQVAAADPALVAPIMPKPGISEGPENPYHITVNLPAYRLRLYEHDKLIKVFPVCIGMPGYRSPINRMNITQVLWNPSWGPPPNAAWAANSSAKGPGKFNPVGVVKMPLRGYVFIHGTYKIKSLGFAWSHGCIRMANEDAAELAWFIQSHVGSNHPEHTIDTYKGSRRTTPVRLNSSVPVETIYETVEVYDDRLMIHPDVYRQGVNSVDRVVQKLGNAGWSTQGVNFNTIGRMIDRSKIETSIVFKKDIYQQQ